MAALRDNGVRLLAAALGTAIKPDGPELALHDVRLLAPVAPSKIFCLGRNYASTAPRWLPPRWRPLGLHERAVNDRRTRRRHRAPPPSLSTHVEHEAELAIVIGKTARFISAADASTTSLAIPAPNDVSARDLQRSDPHPTRGKGFDTFCPVGPWIETDLDTTTGVRLRCRVNQGLPPDASTADMTYDIPFLIE